MKKFISLFIFVQVLFSLCAQDMPTLLGGPRTPLNNSFYNEKMFRSDWWNEGKLFKKEELSLFGVERQVKTSGKTIVYDASVTEVIPDYTFTGKNGITITPENALVEANGKVLQIPIKFVGQEESMVMGKTLSPQAKIGLSNTIDKSLQLSGSTPASIEFFPNGIEPTNHNLHNLFIFKSKFSGEDFIINRFNMRTTDIIRFTNQYYVIVLESETDDCK